MIFVVIPSKHEFDAQPLIAQLHDVHAFVIPNDGPFNLSVKWNQGLDEAEKSARDRGLKIWDVAILNDDLVLGEKCLLRLARGLRERNAIGCAYPDPGLSLKVGELGYTSSDKMAGQTITGYAFMLKGEDGFRFDEQFEFWYGDADFERQLRTQGHSMVAVGGASVTHLRPTESTRGDLLETAKADELRFAHKWGVPPGSLFLAQHPEFGL